MSEHLMFTAAYWAAVAERALKTAGQTGALALGAYVLTDIEQVIPILEGVAVSMLTGAVLSVLTSLASAPISGEGPSLGPELLAGHAKPPTVVAGLDIFEGDDGA